MAGPLHALTLVLLLAGSVALAFFYRRRPSAKQVAFGIVLGVFSALATTTLAVHACHLGQPVAQSVVPAACTSVSLVWVGRPLLRRTLALGAFVTGVVLSLNYVEEVHGSRYVGVSQLPESYGAGPIEAEWHTWLTGLYATPHRKGSGT